MENRESSTGAVFARRMKEARRVAEMTQGQLADALRGAGLTKMSTAAVSAIERQERRVSVEEALTIALVLDIAPAYLLAPDEGALTVGPVEMGAEEARRWITGEDHHNGALRPQLRRFHTEQVPPERKAELAEAAAKAKPHLAAGGAWPPLGHVIDKERDRAMWMLDLVVEAEFVSKGTVLGYRPAPGYMPGHSGGSAIAEGDFTRKKEEL
jgi:transcriptional regulator with XRE-family HTH domain